MEPTPDCPKCGSHAGVERVIGCRCASCPPWICNRCKPYENAGHHGYEFFDDGEDE